MSFVINPYSNRGVLVLQNGDFQALSGLAPQSGAAGWYVGVPAGWTGHTGNAAFNVRDTGSGNLAPNLQTLSRLSGPFTPLYQAIGSLSSVATITLNFSVAPLAGGAFAVGAAIYNAVPGGSPSTTWIVLASSNYSSAGSKTLVATNVAANTPLAVAFWSQNGVGIDDVTVVPT